MIGVAVVAVEAVTGVGVAHDLGVDRAVPAARAQGLDVVDGDALVEVAEQPEPRGLQAGRLVDQRIEAEPALRSRRRRRR